MIKNKNLKIVLPILGLLILIFGFIGFSKITKNNDKDIIVDAKVDAYYSLNEVEEASDIIVLGHKVSEDEPTIIKSNGKPVVEYTLSEFEIETIEKNNSENMVEAGQVITILENEATDKDEKITYHIAGYHKMITDNKYLLFLHYADDNNWYVPTGVTVGKVPLDKNENLIIADSNSDKDYVKNIVEETRNIYL